MKSVGCTAALLYKTKGSSGLLVRDDAVFNNSWHTKVSQSRALAEGSNEVKFVGRKFHWLSNRAENGNLVTTAK